MRLPRTVLKLSEELIETLEFDIEMSPEREKEVRPYIDRLMELIIRYGKELDRMEEIQRQEDSGDIE